MNKYAGDPIIRSQNSILPKRQPITTAFLTLLLLGSLFALWSQGSDKLDFYRVQPRALLREFQLWRIITGQFLNANTVYRQMWLLLFTLAASLRHERLFGRVRTALHFLLGGMMAALLWSIGAALVGDVKLGTGWNAYLHSAGTVAALGIACWIFEMKQGLRAGVVPMWGLVLLFVAVDVFAFNLPEWNTTLPVHVGGAVFGLIAGFISGRSESPTGTGNGDKLPDLDRASRPPMGYDPRVDEVLRKISEQGTDSLSPADREILRDASQQYRSERK